MKNNTILSDFTLMMQKAILEGYTHIFYIEEGGVLRSPTIFKTYLIAQVEHKIDPSPFGSLYKITTPDGFMGVLPVPHEYDIEQASSLT